MIKTNPLDLTLQSHVFRVMETAISIFKVVGLFKWENHK